MTNIKKAKVTAAKCPYTSCEWKKIEKLASVKCVIHKCAKKAKKHIEAL